MSENFVLVYPIFMSMLWGFGALLHFIIWEREKEVELETEPFVSLLIPCYNEEECITEVVCKLQNLNYSNLEIILIDDGSKDNTAMIIDQLAEKFLNVRVVKSDENRGKANALQLGFLCSRGEYLVCIDADSYLDQDAIKYLVHPFIENEGKNIGAITGNPLVRNRNTLLGKIQTVEFASMIGSIKRAQRVSGVMMTISGVVASFRREALADIGLWDCDMITEDIAVTWKMHQRDWEVVYEPRAICWMLVPETLKGLWNQRVRWAKGGIEVLIRHFKPTLKKRKFVLWLLIEQILGITWAFLWLTFFIDKVIIHHQFGMFWFQLLFLMLVSVVQFSIAIVICSRYDKELYREIPAIIWYPVVYWYINTLVVCVATLKTIFIRKKKHATWSSPDRGKSDIVELDVKSFEKLSQKVSITDQFENKIDKYVYIGVTVILCAFFILLVYNFGEYVIANMYMMSLGLFEVIENTIYTPYIINIMISFLFVIVILLIFVLKRNGEHKKQREDLSEKEKLLFRIPDEKLKLFKNNKSQTIINSKIKYGGDNV